MEPEKKSNGALVGLVVIIIILILGGVYMWRVNKNNTGDVNNIYNTSPVTDKDALDLNSLEADLESADTSTGVDVNKVE